MARDGSGTYTLPLPDVVSGTTIDASWANQSLGDIEAALTDSLSRSGSGTMSVAFKSVSGVVGAPGLTFSSETSSGLYRAGANDIRFSVAGIDKMRWNVSGVAIWDGTAWQSLGAGLDAGTVTGQILEWNDTSGRWEVSTAITTTGTRVDVAGDLYIGGTFNNADADKEVFTGYLEVQGDGYVAYADATTHTDVATEGGEIGVGKTRGTHATPTNISAGDTLGMYKFSGQAAGGWRTGGRIVGVANASATDLQMEMQLQIGTTTKATLEGDRLTSEVPLLIKEAASSTVTTPSGYGQLWIKSDAPNTFMFTDDNDVDYEVRLVDGQVLITGTTPTILGDSSFVAGTAALMEIIGGTSSATHPYMRMYGPAHATLANIISFGVGANPMLTLNSGADEIGCNVNTLTRVGKMSMPAGGIIVYENDNGLIGYHALGVQMSGDQAVTFKTGYQNESITGTDRARITDTIMDLYVPLDLDEDASVSSPGAGQGRIWVKSDDPNTLHFTDDGGNDVRVSPSPEGTFTPYFMDASLTDDAASYTTQTGYYQIIGNQCFFYINLVVNDPTGLTGGENLYIGNLPVQAASGLGCPCTVGLGGSLGIPASGASLGAYVIGATNRIFMQVWGTAATGTRAMTCSELTAGGQILVSGHYRIA